MNQAHNVVNKSALHSHFNEKEWTDWLLFIKSFFSSKKKDKPLVHVIGGRDNRPFLTVEMFGVKYRGLLDSGSEISIVNSEFLNGQFSQLPLKKSVDLDYITTANGSSSPVRGYLELPVTVGGRVAYIKFYVVPGATSKLLFGIDVWQAFGIAPEVLSLCNTEFPDGSGKHYNSEVRYLRDFDSLDENQKRLAGEVIKGFEGIAAENKGLGRTHLITHEIDTGYATPIKQRYYMMSPERLAELNRQLDEMLRDDVVEPSTSPWNSPVTLAPKADGSLRFCLDSRKLNSVSKHDSYPLPYITHILDRLREAKYLSSIDLKAAFNQIPLSPSSKEKTAFTVPSRGLFQFKVMCFGLTSAPATQQRLMDRLFGPEFGERIFIYLDDIIVVSGSFDEHIDLLRQVLTRLSGANLAINLSKCFFFRKQLKYLGYVVDESGLHTDPDKIRAITEFPTPSCRKDVKRFLGTASYYRRFIRRFSQVAAPLNALTSTRKSAPPFVWSAEAESAFNALKEALTSAPVLSCPDFTQPFTVHTDASECGVAGMLTQISTFDGEEHPVAYCSRSLNPQERNYSATEREALAVVFVVEHFKPYLEGSRPFKILTDHASLKWFLNLKNPTGRLERWGCRLSPYNFTIEHRRGSDNIVPDALSRSVPVSVTTVPTSDPWYRNIFTRCLTRPQACPNYQIVDDRLLRYTKSKTSLTGDFDWKEVVPEERRLDIIKEHHDTPVGAHLGTEKTYLRLRLKYFWPSMRDDVVNHVSHCAKCKAYKHSNQPNPGLMGSPKVCRRPFQCISIDLVGPLPPSRQQNTYLLVVVCCFSKYCLLFPLRRATSKVIAQRLEDHVFLVHGVPQTVIADNGPQFIGHEVRAMFSKYRVPQIHYTPVYCPQVNTVERYNRTIVTAIATLVGEDHRGWDVNIHKIQFAVNTAVSDTTTFTPFMLVHGREAVMDGRLYGDSEDIEEVEFGSRSDYADQLRGLEPTFQKVEEELKKAHAYNAKYYNRHRRDVEFDVGDLIWKRTHYRSDANKYFSSKLAPRYERCQIVEKLSRLVYVVVDESGKTSKCHVKDIKGIG